MITVYHGTTVNSMENIILNGFDISKIGTGWGTTYGDGIYFSFDPNVANIYSDNISIILEVKIKYKPYKLLSDYRPTGKNRNKINKLREKIIKEGYTCFVSPNNEEVILFDIFNIVSIGYYYI